jgi:tetratricopeptide (TPR) repeat protein
MRRPGAVFLLGVLLLFVPASRAQDSAPSVSDADKQAAEAAYQRGMATRRSSPIYDPAIESDAIADFDEAIRLDPTLAKAFYSRAKFKYVKQRADRLLDPRNRSSSVKEAAGLADISEAIRLDPTNAEYYIERSMMWIGSQNDDAAIADLTEAIRLNPRSIPAYQLRAGRWDAKQDEARMLADYDQILRIDPGNSNARLRRIAYFRTRNEPDKVLAEYDALVKFHSTASDYRARGDFFLDKGEVARATADLDAAWKIDRFDPRTLHDRCLLWIKTGEFDKAIADCDAALSVREESVRLFNNRRFVPKNQREETQWILDALPEKSLDRGMVDSMYFHRGVCWHRKKDYEKALADYNEAIRLIPLYAAAYDGRASIWATCPEEKFRDGKKAVESATRACELTKWKNRSYLATLASAYAETGDSDMAARFQKAADGKLDLFAVPVKPDSPLGRILRAMPGRIK